MNNQLKAFMLFFVGTVASQEMLWGMDRNIPFYQQYEQKGFTKKWLIWKDLKEEMPQLKDVPDLRRSLKKLIIMKDGDFANIKSLGLLC